MTVPAAVRYPIVILDAPTIWRGDSFTWQHVMLQSDGVTAQDLTPFGTAWTSMLRRSLDSSQAVSFTVSTSLAAGSVTLSLTGTQTAALTRGETYGFDIQATGGADSPFTVWTGTIKVDGEWTHA